ncbi:MAG TPA: AMP-binding protein [Verrucomicrobiae bacterium]|nr:AMP-binding protein [Verrucomicrobiae bacterium]
MPVIAAIAIVLVLTFVVWRMYRRGAAAAATDTSPFGLTDCFDERSLVSVPHQKGVRWLTEVFTRSAERFPDLTALQVPHTGESLTFAELERRAEEVAEAVAPFLTGPDQVVAVAMSQDNWQVVAAHLGVLKAGGTFMFLDAALPDALISHMLKDARPVVVLTRGMDQFRGLPALNVMALPERKSPRVPPDWLDDPAQRLAAIFYTSGTTGMPKGVECPHAGYVNLALSYADYFDLLPGMDATSLTSSLAYDGSISEMYSAWVSGCAVVLLTKEQLRSGTDLVAVLREAEVTVLFCPPVLLTTLTDTPELDLPYPLCRYIVPAGEAFPEALVEPWTRGRRQIINTYGPTEASTDTSRQSLRPGEPVTIGSPFPNVTYVVLEVGQLRPLPHGQVGELCIGGVHLARGYHNLPKKTARKFITHPQLGRLYRTGDKCTIDIRTQRAHFLGRIDAQLKVRGHRVEAEAVEHILETQFGEIDAAVVANQNDSLVAFVAARSLRDGTGSEVVPAPAPWAAGVTDILAKQLPPPSVPSRIFLVQNFVTNPISGKIDRKRLPDLAHLLRNGTPRAAESDGQAKATPERRAESLSPDCEAVLAICNAVFETPLGPDDGFAESGGHSILIARLAQRLEAAGWVVPLRALLGECNTARKVAVRPRRSPDTGRAPAGLVKSDAAPAAGRDEAAAEVLSIRYFTTLQVLFAIVLYLPAFLAILGVADLVGVGAFETARFSTFMIAGLLAYLLGLIAPFAALLWVMLLKLVLGGDIHKNNVRPGVYPKWSRMHLRVWRIERMERTVLRTLAAMYRSAPLTSFFLRQFGATVGRNLHCAPDASLSGPLDLISFEDDVSVATGAYIHTTKWSGQSLQVGPIRLESGCKIGMRAAVANNVTVGRGAWITPFTPILADVGTQEMWEGAPARLAGRCTELKRTARACRYTQPIWLLELLNILMQGFLTFWLSVAPTIAISWVGLGFVFPGRAVLQSGYFGATPLFDIVWRLALYGFITNWVSIVVTSTLGCLFIRCTASAPGLYPSHGLRGALLMYRMNQMNVIQRRWTWTIIGQYLRALAGVHFPRVGASECDLMVNLVPELASADSRAFWCHQAFTNMLDYGAEHLKLRRLELPRNFLCGNNSVAEYGKFPANFLLGVSTPASDIRFRRQMRSRLPEPVTVAGNPPVRFASTSLDAENETPPGFSLFLTRVVLNDLFSIGTLRITEGLVFAISYLGLSRLGLNLVANVLVSFLLTELTLILLAGVIKAGLVGRQWGADHATPFWSWKHFAYFFTQDCFFVWCRSSLQFFAGTVLASRVLRLMGCRIGHGTLVSQPLQCSDWNAVQFGDDCVVDGFLQFHTFEDMILRVKRTRILDRCAVNFGATVMGGAVMEQDTTLVPLALVLKEMNMPTATYEGSPAEAVERSPR